jgi:mono/diheme cytochrome c family protein
MALRLCMIAWVSWLLAGGDGWAADGTNAPAFLPVLPDSSLYFRGRYVFERNCQVCHGALGNGRGEMASQMAPKPRSFRSGIFKYRSTPAGALPTDQDLQRTVRDGIANTSMPTFAGKLSAREIEAVVEYVKVFSTRWKDPANYAPPLQLPEAPGWFADERELAVRARKGAALFTLACASCHGETGDGKGAAAAELRDAWEDPCPPADLRQPVLRVGRRPEDIYRVLVTGIAGTPMPAFNEAVTEEQRWELVAFLEGLKRRDPSASR